MSDSNRVMFRFQVHPDVLPEYREFHAAVWPDMLVALKAAGWNNYSIFTSPDGLVIGYAEVADMDATQAAMDASEVNARWQQTMNRFFAAAGPDEEMDRLDEAFHLETQLAALSSADDQESTQNKKEK